MKKVRHNIKHAYTDTLFHILRNFFSLNSENQFSAHGVYGYVMIQLQNNTANI